MDGRVDGSLQLFMSKEEDPLPNRSQAELQRTEELGLSPDATATEIAQAQGQKDLILKNAKKHFNDDVITKLDKILEPQYLGWEIPKYDKQTTDKKIIVFNHRAHTYKNYPWFLKQMDKLWEQRQDFEVWVPLADSTEGREYLTNDRYERDGYFSKLSSCYIGICGKQNYAGWAISATDGMSVGVPYLFLDDGYYHELAGDAGYYFKTDLDFQKSLNHLSIC